MALVQRNEITFDDLENAGSECGIELVLVIWLFSDKLIENFDVISVETCFVSPPHVPVAVGANKYLIDRNTLLTRANHVATDIRFNLTQELGFIRFESLGQPIERHDDSK